MVGKDRKIDLSQNYFLYFHWCMPKKTLPLVSLKFARVAELVDALDSKSSDSNIVPVRPRPRVQKPPQFMRGFFCTFTLLIFHTDETKKIRQRLP